MSPIGRIFIVLNLVLAAAFLGWASSALSLSQEWKTKHDTVASAKDQLERDKDTEISALRVDLNATREALDQAEEARDLAEANATQLRSDLEVARRESDQQGASLAQIAATLDDVRATIAQVSEARDRAETERREAVEARDAAQDEAQAAELAKRDAEESLSGAETRIADLEVDLQAERDRASHLDTIIAMARAKGWPIDDLSAQPDIEATVVEARYDDSVAPGLVALNVGTAQGVQKGMTFEIFRGQTYKGRVRVETVDANRCAALIVVPIEGVQMAAGDSAATNL